MRIKLDYAEMKLAEYIAKERQKHDTKSGYTNRNQSGFDDLKIGIQGMEGEIAICKAMNIYPDLATDHIQKQDLYIKGYSFDVKTTYKSHFLNVAYWKAQNPCDFYALVIKDGETFDICGYISKWDMFRRQNVTKGPRGDYWRIHKSKLKPFKEFKKGV